MIIVWDEPKRLANIDKHGLDFADLTLGYFEDSIVWETRKPRFKSIGWFGDRLAVAIFAPLGSEAISIVSLRFASANERTLFHERKTRH